MPKQAEKSKRLIGGMPVKGRDLKSAGKSKPRCIADTIKQGGKEADWLRGAWDCAATPTDLASAVEIQCTLFLKEPHAGQKWPSLGTPSVLNDQLLTAQGELDLGSDTAAACRCYTGRLSSALRGAPQLPQL